MNIHKILKCLPHRYPFLLVDRVIKIEDGYLEAVKNVTMNEPQFMGHFPENPVMPGVLMIEALAQAGGIYAVETNPEITPDNAEIFFMSIDNVKFRKPVIPGDQLLLKIKQLNKKRDIYKMSGEAYVDGKLVCETILMAMVRKKS
jgi:beta-hydroxyacyl-ACP dehydratase FabZ